MTLRYDLEFFCHMAEKEAASSAATTSRAAICVALDTTCAARTASFSLDPPARAEACIFAPFVAMKSATHCSRCVAAAAVAPACTSWITWAARNATSIVRVNGGGHPMRSLRIVLVGYGIEGQAHGGQCPIVVICALLVHVPSGA